MYMADAGAQTTEKPNHTLRGQVVERLREGNREFLFRFRFGLNSEILIILQSKMGLTIRSMLWANIILIE